jgi:hypothetical protein
MKRQWKGNVAQRSEKSDAKWKIRKRNEAKRKIRKRNEENGNGNETKNLQSEKKRKNLCGFFVLKRNEKFEAN